MVASSSAVELPLLRGPTLDSLCIMVISSNSQAFVQVPWSQFKGHKQYFYTAGIAACWGSRQMSLLFKECRTAWNPVGWTSHWHRGITRKSGFCHYNVFHALWKLGSLQYLEALNISKALSTERDQVEIWYLNGVCPDWMQHKNSWCPCGVLPWCTGFLGWRNSAGGVVLDHSCSACFVGRNGCSIKEAAG